jgi:aminoglycoside N3'-acetyltransferase
LHGTQTEPGESIDSPTVTLDDIRQGIRDLDLSSLPVCLHASLRSFGMVDGGPDTVLDALLAEGCTVMLPAFTGSFLIAPPTDLLLERNGWDMSSAPDVQGAASDQYYDPGALVIDPEMGAIARALVGRPGRARGDHPLDSFAAIGPLAVDLIAGQHPLDVYAPFRSLIDLGGAIVLMGVGLTSLTVLHLAEHRAGRNLFHRWARDSRGQIVTCEIGSCSNGYDAFEPIIAPLGRETIIGASRLRTFNPSAVIEAATGAIRADPEITRCANPDCMRCEHGIAGGPILI